MSAKEQFFSLHRQGFVRVAACTPLMSVADPKSNTAETIALMREGNARNVDLMLFPELGISAYAIDDLLLQDALLRRVGAQPAIVVEASEGLAPALPLWAPRPPAGRLHHRAAVISKGGLPRGVPEKHPPHHP